MLDLLALPKRYLDKLGRERVAEIVGVSTATISMWNSRGQFPLTAVQKLIDSDPTPIHEVQPLYTNPIRTTKLSIIVPSATPVNAITRQCLDRMMDRDMEYEPSSFNSLYHVRNIAMAKWLRTNHDWAFWSDADMVHPCGDAVWFKRVTERPNYPDFYAGMNAIFRMLAHKKTLVSVVYIEKSMKGQAVFQGAEAPVMRQMVSRGPSPEVIKRDWCGFGGVLMHRSVPEDIIKAGLAPEMKDEYMLRRLNYRYGFFNPSQEHFGDDISFCDRAARAGHPVFVDFAVMSEHIGSRCYGYEDLRRNP